MLASEAARGAPWVYHGLLMVDPSRHVGSPRRYLLFRVDECTQGAMRSVALRTACEPHRPDPWVPHAVPRGVLHLVKCAGALAYLGAMKPVVPLALFALLTTGCGGPSYGHSPKYVPLDRERPAVESADPYDPAAMRHP